MSKSHSAAECANRNEFTDLPPGSLRVLQVSDPHIFSTPEQRLLGLNTLDSFRQVLTQAGNRLSPFDFILATGDLVHDASPEGYDILSTTFSDLASPVYCLAGNHDDPKVMERRLNAGQVTMARSAQHGNWQIILLNSRIEKQVGGRLDHDNLELLEEHLAAEPDRHALVCLHHHPMPIGSTWLDGISLENAEAFFAVIDRYPQVRGVVYGHIHQTFEAERNGVRLLGTPSTCFQFTPKQKGFEVEQKPPGYRWLALLPDGEIRSGVEHLCKFSNDIDLDSAGYG